MARSFGASLQAEVHEERLDEVPLNALRLDHGYGFGSLTTYRYSKP